MKQNVTKQEKRKRKKNKKKKKKKLANWWSPSVIRRGPVLRDSLLLGTKVETFETDGTEATEMLLLLLLFDPPELR